MMGVETARILIAGWALLASAGSSRAAESSGSSWVAEYNVAVRMSDGVELSTDVYRPAGLRRSAILPYLQSLT
jgi:predicted acyl esterase